MRYLYKFHKVYKDPNDMFSTLLGWSVEHIKVKKPDFSPQRLHNELQGKYKERQKQQKLYLKAMRNGVNRSSVKTIRAI